MSKPIPKKGRLCCFGSIVDYFHTTATFTVAADMDLGSNALVQFFAMGYDAYSAVALASDVL
jgi:hypothetical protein